VLYYATLVYLGLVYLRPTDLIEGWSQVPVVMIMSVVSAPFLAMELLQHPRRLIELPQDRLLLGYWFAITLSNLASGWLGGALLGFTAFAQVVFQYVLIRTAIRRPSQLRGVVWLLIGIMMFHAASGIVQHSTGFGFGGVEPMLTDGQLRIRSIGIFNDPNDLALFILVGVPFLMATWLGRGVPMRARLLALTITVPLILAVHYTNSRGAVLGLGAAFAVFGWRRFGRTTGTAVVILGLAGLVALGPSRMQETDTEEASAQGRIQAWGAGLQMLISRPLTGVGYSRFTDYNPGLVAHNSYVHSFAELGLLGGACFVGMVFWYFESLRRVARRGHGRRYPLGVWHDAFVATGAGFFVGVCFLSRQYNPVPYTLLALGACYVQLVEDDGTPALAASGRDHALVLGLTFMTVLLFWLSVRLFAVWGG
jgi:hypothetical protein